MGGGRLLCLEPTDGGAVMWNDQAHPQPVAAVVERNKNNQ